MKALAIALVAVVAGCSSGAATPSPGSEPRMTNDGGAADAASDGAIEGNSYVTAADAPRYDGTSFRGMQIFDTQDGAYLDDARLLATLDATRLVFFGEQHETAPVQELELWLLQKMTARRDDVTLAMEHFQHDEQSIIDDYLAGKITTAQFEAKSQPWPKYATFWKPLVEHMKGAGRPIVALNVPDEALEMIYAKYPQTPLGVFNGWGASFRYASSIAPRPLAKWDATYQDYFKSNFDYSAHGQSMGMTYDQALDYFTDLALIRDETMGYFTAKALEGLGSQTSEHGTVLTVAGDWHVQTALATPDRAVRYFEGESVYSLLTTATSASFESIRSEPVAGRKRARFILVYEQP